MAVYLVCEDRKGDGTPGLDNRVLDRLVIQFHNLNVQIVSTGGSSGLKAVRAYLHKPSSNNFAFCVEDRDYVRTRTKADASWANPTASTFYWRRHEIENYLLHARVVLTLFDDYRAAGQGWAATLPTTEPDVLVMLQAIAATLLEHHVGEVLRVELQGHSAGLQFGAPKPLALPGSRIPGRTEWIVALQQEADRLCTACTSAAARPEFQSAEIADRYQSLLGQFQSTVFLSSGEFLMELGGHELMAALASHLKSIGAPSRFTDSFLEEELLRVLTSIYQPGVIYQPDDFAELAAILRQYA